MEEQIADGGSSVVWIRCFEDSRWILRSTIIKSFVKDNELLSQNLNLVVL